MSFLVTADLHLNDNPRDSDRWNLFPWLKTQITKYKIKDVLVLGDITDAKDRHSSKLVNRLCEETSQLAHLANIIYLQGNHDFIDEGSPFFGFMRLMEGRITFTTTHMTTHIDGLVSSKEALFLACTRNYQEAWKDLNFKNYSCIFTHQTYDGCLSENGTQLSGIPPSIFKGVNRVISGDVHVPQKVGKNIEYVGAPYHIKFGDTFNPRVLMCKNGEFSDLYFKGRGRELIEARSIAAIDDTKLDIGTQVKIRVKLKRSEYPEWPEIRKAITELAQRRGWELCGLELSTIETKPIEASEETLAQTPKDIIIDYAKRNKLNDSSRMLGLKIIKEVGV